MRTSTTDLQSTGHSKVNPLSAQQVSEILAYLVSKPVHLGCHVKHGAGPPVPWGQRASANVCCWDMHDVILAPHLFEHALSYTDAVAEYLGVETPLLYSINAFCTQPGHDIRPDIQGWHRDADDTKFVPLFVYLTDVAADAAQEVRLDRDGIRHEFRITGPRGTSFLSNTMLEHRGLRPQTSERIIWWARWGISDPPPSYVWDRLEPLDCHKLGDRFPGDARLQHSIRLVAA